MSNESHAFTETMNRLLFTRRHAASLILLACCVGSRVLAASLIVRNDQITLKLNAVNRAFTRTAKHIKVYAEPGRFGGWPASLPQDVSDSGRKGN